MFADLSIWHILLLIAIVTLLFGTKRIPEIGASIGKGIQSFKKGLQDAKNRRQINADEKLKPIFGGKSSVSMFEMTKLVNKHLK